MDSVTWFDKRLQETKRNPFKFSYLFNRKFSNVLILLMSPEGSISSSGHVTNARINLSVMPMGNYRFIWSNTKIDLFDNR